MGKKNFFTRINHLAFDDGKSLVITLGDCTYKDSIGPERVISYPDAGQETVRHIVQLDFARMTHGIMLVVSSAVVRDQFEQVKLIQSHLAFCYVKFVWFPQQDTSTPDPLGLGGDKGPLADIAYQSNNLDNLPNLLTSPRAKVLENITLKPSVLLLAPGPSLNRIIPHIKALSERFITLCLSRTLMYCQEQGVTPDIVVQLDTHGEQQNFFPADMDFSKSWLFALSCAPVKKYINRFAGVFWIDTFEAGAFKEQYEIRNSWLSSFIPMLGVVELFHPSKLLMAGSDLAYSDTDNWYFNGDEAGTDQKRKLTDQEALAAVNCHHFPVRLANGDIGKTHLQLFATAYEAETIIAELALNMKTACYNITPSGLLNPDVLAPAAPADFIREPLLDRAAFQQAMGEALKADDLPDAGVVKRMLPEQLQRAEFMLRQTDALNASGDPKALKDNPILSAGKLISHLHPVANDRARLHLSRKVLEKQKEMLQKTITLFRLNDWSLRGKSIPVLCFPDEKQGFSVSLGSRFPKGKWEFRHTWDTSSKAIENKLPTYEIPKFLHANPVTLISRQYAEAADYLLPFLPSDKTLILEDVLEQPWPGVPSK